MAKVSIILPTYNRKNTLIEAIESVLSQTFSDFELIVIDDGSDDGTSDIMHDFLTDPRVKYLYQKNKGRSSARNKGLNEASGEYITFLDSDDVYKPRKLEAQVNVLEHNSDYDLVYCLFSLMEYDGEMLDNHKHPDYEFSGKVYPEIITFRGSIITTPGVMARKSAIQKAGFFDEKMNICEDLDLWRRISRYSRIFQIRENLIVIRLPENKKLPLWDFYRAREFFYDKSLNEDEELTNDFSLFLKSELYIWYTYLALRQGMFRLSLYLMVKFFFLGPKALHQLPKILRASRK